MFHTKPGPFRTRLTFDRPLFSTARAVVVAVMVSLVVAGHLFAQDRPAKPSPALPSTAAAVSTPDETAGTPRLPSGYAAQEYIVAPDDVLDVFVMDVTDLSRSYRVSPTGYIAFPMLEKPVAAAGQTLDEIARAIESELRAAGLVMRPYVSVTVKESRTHSVAIGGAVKKPEIYPVFGRTTLLNVLSAAGGVSENAGSVVRVTRGEIAMRTLASDSTAGRAEVEPSLSVDLKRLLESGDPGVNVPIFPGDSVTVPVGGVVYVVGAVNKPGGFVLTTERQGMTVMQALALAEDTKATAVKDKAMIVRRDPQLPNGRQEIPVKLRDLMAGKQPDIVLEANDILYVPDSSSKKAFRRGAEAAVQMLTGIVIWQRP